MVANGHVLRRPVGSTQMQRPFLLRNEQIEGRRQFRQPIGLGGPCFRQEHIGRGLAIGDLDNDGWPDLVISHQNAPVVLLRNVCGSTLGKGNHWAGVQLKGKAGRDLVGTTLTLDVGGQQLTRFVKGGGGYLSTSDHRIPFGLGKQLQGGRLTIRWPGGSNQQFDVTEVDRYWQITEGVSVLQSIPKP